MLSFLTRQAVKRASVTLLLTAAVLLFGTYAATQLKRRLGFRPPQWEDQLDEAAPTAEALADPAHNEPIVPVAQG